MKTILFIFLFIASSQCGVLKDDLKETGSSSEALSLLESKLVILKDIFVYSNITFFTDVIIDVTKDKESTNTATGISNLAPGIHKWEMKFLVTEQPAEEINRILSIIEATANKTGQLIGKDCKTEETDVICHFNINVEATKPPVSNMHKREIKEVNSTQPIDIEEVNRLIKLAEASENKTGEFDGRNCKTVNGAVICNVYIPENSTK